MRLIATFCIVAFYLAPTVVRNTRWARSRYIENPQKIDRKENQKYRQNKQTNRQLNEILESESETHYINTTIKQNGQYILLVRASSVS